MTRGDILFEQINKDMISAMKSKDALTLSTLRMLKGAIDLERINKKLDCVSDDDIITIISKQIKTRKESILEFRKGNRIIIPLKFTLNKKNQNMVKFI